MRVVAADATDRAPLERALGAHDAVLSALGPTRRNEQVCARSARALVEAMSAVGPRRLVVLSAAPCCAVAPGSRWCRA
ncbi:hypothetical protein ER308_08640 [Egibacter rhizosphaerae]|uniref:NAD(P)-binding domain-containing protein n=1 Tax=Egibacter rhizosphaerae TaxID=1670831 RepID=A0A411YL83_9ACTN|nr:hypothetical protein ER308_08640 [Egibacter rhizosphaerae]